VCILWFSFSLLLRLSIFLSEATTTTTAKWIKSKEEKKGFFFFLDFFVGGVTIDDNSLSIQTFHLPFKLD
jgi:hypothetical protein